MEDIRPLAPVEVDRLLARLVARRLDATSAAERDDAGDELLALLTELRCGGTAAGAPSDRTPPRHLRSVPAIDT